MKFEPQLHKLSNGVAVLFDSMDIETVSMKIRINGGTKLEKPDEFGISHFIEHMLFNGTEKYTTTKITRDILNDNGGTRGGSTSLSRTEYHGRILVENFHVLLVVLEDMVLNIKIVIHDIEKERVVIIQEKKRSQDDEIRTYNWLIHKNIFPNSYFEKYDGLG